MEFRKLRPEEIDLRVGTLVCTDTVKGVSLLCYKDARVDMQILDETVGPENWQREHYECKGNLFCRVGIKCDGEWVWKADCGTESQTEREKGESSDSFKRACVCWGIGRELYTSPFIWIPLSAEYFSQGRLTKKAQREINGFYVSEIDYTEKGEVKKLVIMDKNGNVVWRG